MADTTFTTPRSNRSYTEDVDQTPDTQTGVNSSQLSDKGKIRADAIGAKGRRCLIQNAPANAAVQYAHVFPRRIMTKEVALLERIEKNWGMNLNTLNLDTRRNIIKLSSNLHILHDNPPDYGAWLLLPPEQTIKYYYNKVTKDNDIRPGPYRMHDKFTSYKTPGRNWTQYTLVVLGATMQENIIFVQPDANASAQNTILYFYPYSALPEIPSHLHPRFAILEAGRRLQKRGRRLPPTGQIRREIWDQIQTIYAAWTRDPSTNVEESSDDQTDSTETEEGDQDGASEGTGNRSVHSNRKRGRGDDGSPTPSKQGRNSKAGSAGGRRLGGLQEKDACDCGASCLSGETLNEHEVVTGGQDWNKDRIVTWVHDIVVENTVSAV